MGISDGGEGVWIAKVKLSSLFDTLVLSSAFRFYISLFFRGYTLLDLTELDWAVISVDSGN